MDDFFYTLAQLPKHQAPAPQPPNALMLAANDGDTDAIRRIARLGSPSLEAKDLRGWTALLFACRRGHADCVELLLELGADIEARSGIGFLAEDVAFDAGHPDLAGWIILRRLSEPARRLAKHEKAEIAKLIAPPLGNASPSKSI